MFTLKSRKDGFRLLLPKEFLCEEIVDKYAQILQNQKSFILSPIAFLNETIQKVQVLGFNSGTIQQQQTSRGESITGDPKRFAQNRFLHTASDHTYRSEVSPLQLIDKTLNIKRIPDYFILDREGNIVYRDQGFPGVTKMKEELLKALKVN